MTFGKERWKSYGFALICVAVALALRLALNRFLDGNSPYITFFPAIVVAAWRGGLGPGLLATTVGAVAATLLALPPVYAFHLRSSGDLIGLGLYAFFGVVISILSENVRQQKNWFFETLASIGDGVIVTDKQGDVRFLNPVAEELTGWRLVDAIGLPVEDVFVASAEATGEPVENPCRNALKNRRTEALANGTVLRSKGGAKRPIDDTAAPIRDDAGRVRGAVLVFRDISLRRSVETERDRQKEQLQSIIDSITDSFGAFDRDFRYIYANAKTSQMMGQTPQELAGKCLWDLLPVIDPHYQAEMERAMRTRQPVLFRTYHGKTRQWLETRAFPASFGLSVYATDVTERKRIEDAFAELAAIVQSSNDAIISRALDGSIQTWNPGAERMYGYSQAEAIGKNTLMLVPSDRLAEENGLMERIDKGEVIPLLETARLRKDGRRIDVAITVSPIRNSDGVVTGASEVARDVSERKRAEELYRDNAENLRMAISAANMGTWKNELTTRRVTWSPELEEIFGLAPGTLPETEKAFYDLIHPEDRAAATAAIERGIAERTDFRFEFRFSKPTGEQGWLESRGRAFYDEKGNPIRLAGVGVDITERKKAEEELTRNAHQLARANADLQQFAYVASHDLQEPLRSVVSFSQLLERRYGPHLDGAALEYINYLVTGAKRMSALVDDLLIYSRLANTEQLPLKPVALDDTVQWALNNLKAAIDESGARIHYDSLPVVQGDVIQMVQIFQNLIGNAIKYRGEKSPEIWISAERAGREWIITVADNGIGIDPKYHERIFGVFQRLHGRDYAGTGIGLSICKKLVERYGGRIWVESSGEGGSKFRFTLPVATDV